MNRICTVLALALLLTGCVSSKNPIGETVGFKPDPALTGVWIGRDEDNKGAPPSTVYFLPKKDDGMTALVITLPNKEDGGDWDVFDLKLATLGSNHFMSVRILGDGDNGTKEYSPYYGLMLYRFTDANTLMIYGIEKQKIGTVVASGRLAGKAQKDDKNEWDDVLITADPESLDAFMKTPEAAALFDEKPIVLHRQKPPQ